MTENEYERRIEKLEAKVDQLNDQRIDLSEKLDAALEEKDDECTIGCEAILKALGKTN